MPPLRDPRDYKLDLSSQAADAASNGATNRSAGRPFVSVHFACCGVYTRVYRTADRASYRGRCPRCGVAVNFRVGENGTSARFFTVH
jgi:hypothetical protein